jgi:hypothetical protein
MALTNLAKLPLPLVIACEDRGFISQGSDLSGSAAFQPARQVAMQKRHRGELTEDVTERIWSLFGQAVHEILRRAAISGDPKVRALVNAIEALTTLAGVLPVEPERLYELLADLRLELAQVPQDPSPIRVFAEERWERTILGWRVACRVDHLALDDELGALTDYKTAAVYPVKQYIEDGVPKEEWVAQVNIQHYLAPDHIRDEITRLGRLRIVALIRDWRLSEKRKEGLSYPPWQVHTIELPMWGVEKTRAYLEERVAIHQAAQLSYAHNGTLPECTLEERWEKPTKWAVVKTTKSLKNHLTREAAEQHATRLGYRVEIRPGEVTRCELYCSVRSICTQGLAAVAAMKAAVAANATPP